MKKYKNFNHFWKEYGKYDDFVVSNPAIEEVLKEFARKVWLEANRYVSIEDDSRLHHD